MAKIMGKKKTQKEKDEESKVKAEYERAHRTIKFCKKHKRYHGGECADCIQPKPKEPEPKPKKEKT